MKEFIGYTLLFLVWSKLAFAQISQPKAMRVYRDRDQIILADSSGANPNTFPASKVSITPIGNRVRVGIDNTYMYFPLAKFRDKNGNAYSTTSVDSAVTRYVKTLPDASDELATRLKYVTSSGLFATSTADIVQFDNASWERKTGTVNGATPGYGAMVYAGPIGTYYQRKYDGWVNVKWFGAKGDGATDDFTAIEKAYNYLYRSIVVSGVGNMTGVLFMPRGVYETSQRIVVPNKIRMVGEASRASEIRPTTAYADTILVELSNKNQTGGKVNTFTNCLEQISLDMRGKTGLIGVYSEEINEQSGLRNFCIRNLQYIGIWIQSPQNQAVYGPQNFYIEDGEIIFNNAETTSSRGIRIDINNGTFQSCQNISFVGKNATAWGIEISNAAGWRCGSMHFENLARGFSLAERGGVFAFTIQGINAQNTVPTVIYLRGTNDSYGYAIMAVRAPAGANAVQDFRNNPNRTNVPGPLGYYAVSSEAYGSRNIRCTNVLFEKYFGLPTYADNAAAAAGTVKIGELYQTSDGTIKRRTN